MNSSRFCLFCATYSGFTLYRWRVILIGLSRNFVTSEAQVRTPGASASLFGSRAPQLGALHRVVVVRARATAKTLAQTLAEELARQYGYQYGRDFINWGYRADVNSTLKGLVQNIPELIKNDAMLHKPLSTFPLTI